MADAHRSSTLPSVEAKRNISAFECWIPDAPWGDASQIINAQSRSAAKVVYWRHVVDAWPDIPYTAVRVRKLGSAQSDASFLIGVRYRGIPHARCGDRVTWKNGGGVIVGFGGGGAWLEVLSDEGWRGYVHPGECYEYA